MAQLLVLVKLLSALLGANESDWACYEANPAYEPREEYAAACVYDPGQPAKLVLYMTWDSATGLALEPSDEGIIWTAGGVQYLPLVVR